MMTAEGAASDYDTDILKWSEQQAELLLRRAANAFDWDNLAEEIVDVGGASCVPSRPIPCGAAA